MFTLCCSSLPPLPPSRTAATRTTQNFTPSPAWGFPLQNVAKGRFWSGSNFDVAAPTGEAALKTLGEGNDFSWARLIPQNAMHGEKALAIYKTMLDEGVTPTAYTFVAALTACSSIADLKTGKEIHAHVIENGIQSDIFIANAIVSMYAKCGSMIDAEHVFERMPHRDVVSWNAMIMGYVQHKEGESALQFYAQMQHEGFSPNDRTFVAALKAVCSLAAAEEGKQIDGELLKVGCLEKGRTIHSQVSNAGLDSNLFVANALVGMYAKCRSMRDAARVFEKMSHRDVLSWNTMIMGYANRKAGEAALHLYARMLHEGFRPNARTFVAALKACGCLAAQEEAKQVNKELVKTRSLEKGRAIHSQVVENGYESDSYVANTLVDMYVKCGSMIDAGRVVKRMSH